jgi:hypothetical protein
MKGQFFVISTIVIASVLVLIVQYILDFSKIDLTAIEKEQELEYIGQIKTVLRRAANISYNNGGCNRLDEDLKDAENVIRIELAERGILFNSSHVITSCPTTNFRFNLTSRNFFSNTVFTYS